MEEAVKGKRMRLWVYLAFLFVITTGLAGAQTQPVALDTIPLSATRWGVGTQGGYFRSSRADQGAYYFGGVFRYKIGSMLAFEGTLGFRGKQVFNFGTVSGNQLYADVSAVPLTASLVLFLPLRSTSFVPYGLIGAGLYILSMDYSPDINKVTGDETKTKLGGHLGAGASLSLTPAVIAHADVRYLLLSKIFGSGPVYDFSSKGYNGASFTLGLMFYF
jgi:opacity protein-like surface antigen